MSSGLSAVTGTTQLIAVNLAVPCQTTPSHLQRYDVELYTPVLANLWREVFLLLLLLLK
jgi:hypothetical protein